MPGKKEELDVIMQDYLKTLEEFTSEKTVEAINLLKQAFKYKQSLVLFCRVCVFFSIGLVAIGAVYLMGHQETLVKWLLGVISFIILFELVFIFMAWHVFMHFLFASDNVLRTVKSKYEFARKAKAETALVIQSLVAKAEEKLDGK